MGKDRTEAMFPATAPAANPVFYRTYSRIINSKRETWSEVTERTVEGIARLGKLTNDEKELLLQMQQQMKCLPSGRWLWVGGTEWIDREDNYSGAYNCTSTSLNSWEAFTLMMDLAMMGSGTGAVIEPHYISQLPTILNHIEVLEVIPPGGKSQGSRAETTSLSTYQDPFLLVVGDSRQGWVSSYRAMLNLSSDPSKGGRISLIVDLSNVRPAGEPLEGFGGTANPARLTDLYERVARILNRARGRQLTAIECCLLIDEAAVTVVAGNIRRSAGMRQFDAEDHEAAAAKDYLWSQAEDGSWRIDPERDALRMANHTRVFHAKPSYETVLTSVSKQFYSGEGAIQFAPEAIARANVDVLGNEASRKHFIKLYCEQGKKAAGDYLKMRKPRMSALEVEHRLERYGLNPCGEIIGTDFHCNLSEVHLNLIDPADLEAQDEAFRAGAIAVAALLNHQFKVKRYKDSRDLDPIVGVSFTGLFDFFVHAFGVEWLQWWEKGRPDDERGQAFRQMEARYLARWKRVVHDTVAAYCNRRGLRVPNRCTTVQPAGTKSLLTGASPGWHPPKAQRFIRRITFRKNDPVALACLDYGYTVVPSQSDKDEQGQLLNDPFDPRCTEWLVEIPTEVSWANLPGADVVDINSFSALAQFDFYMQVQTYYTAHNTSATIEYRENEIEPLAEKIYQAIENDRGYISAALLARFDANSTFPRLPFEPIDKETYQYMSAQVAERRQAKGDSDFLESLLKYDNGLLIEAGPAGCDGDKCLFSAVTPSK
jgi:ribonucleotide reductase class II